MGTKKFEVRSFQCSCSFKKRLPIMRQLQKRNYYLLAGLDELDFAAYYLIDTKEAVVEKP